MSEKALQIAEKEEKPKAKEKREDISIWIEFKRIVRRDKKAFLSDQYKEIEGHNTMGKTSRSFKNDQEKIASRNVACRQRLI